MTETVISSLRVLTVETQSSPDPVAQICNLPYRRFAIGRRPTTFGLAGAVHRSDGWQVENLRYGRLKICATGAVPDGDRSEACPLSLDLSSIGGGEIGPAVCMQQGWGEELLRP